MLGPLSSRVARICDRALAVLPEGDAKAIVTEVRRGLDEPLRVAVAGPVNAGKSTLVNALLRQRVAPTDVSECTRIVTWYRAGVPERVEVVQEDGTRVRLPLAEGGRLPSRVRRDGEAEIAHLEVFLSNAALDQVVIIDTPGLASAHDELSQATRDLLALDARSRVAVAHADAVIFLLGDAGIDETTALETFRALSGGLQTSPHNAVGVLSKADTLGDGSQDLRVAADDAAEAIADRLRGAVSTVVPLLGLVAETIDTGGLTDDDVQALRVLASRPEAERRALLLTPDRFVNAQVEGVSHEARGQLLEILDLAGIELALGHLAGAGDAPTSVVTLADALRADAGIDPLRTLLRRTFSDHADVLKAGWAMAGIERAAFALDPVTDVEARAVLVDEVEELELEPAMHRLAELRILQELAAGRITLPGPLASDVQRVLRRVPAAEALALPVGSDGGAVREAAAAGVHRWKAFANDGRTSPQQRWAAEVVVKTYEQLWQAG